MSLWILFVVSRNQAFRIHEFALEIVVTLVACHRMHVHARLRPFPLLHALFARPRLPHLLACSPAASVGARARSCAAVVATGCDDLVSLLDA